MSRADDRGEAGDRGGALVTLGLLAIVSSTAVVLGGSSPASLVLRIVGVGLLVVAAARSRRRSDDGLSWLAGLTAALGLYLVVATVLHGRWTDAATTLAALAGAAAATATWARRLDPAVLLDSARRVLLATTVASLALGLAAPGTAIERDRLRGWFENANTVGFTALALGTIAVLRPGRPLPTAAALAASAAALAWSASRTSALALALVVVVALVVRRSASLVLVGIAVGVGVLCLAAWLPSAGDVLSGLLRHTDSRSGTVDLALDVLRRRPTTGIGLGAEDGVHVSSPLMAVVHAGVPGLLAWLGMATALLAGAARGGWRSWTATGALLLHSTAESWLLSPISPLLLTALVVLRGVIGTDAPATAVPTKPHPHGHGHPHGHTRPHPYTHPHAHRRPDPRRPETR